MNVGDKVQGTLTVSNNTPESEAPVVKSKRKYWNKFFNTKTEHWDIFSEEAKLITCVYDENYAALIVKAVNRDHLFDEMRAYIEHIASEGFWGTMNSPESLVEILDEHKDGADIILFKLRALDVGEQ